MSARARRLQRIWYEGQDPGVGLRALAWLYGAATAMRRTLYARGLLPQVRLPVPVVVVGNLVAGGAGKTPLTIALVERLRDAGWRPGVVSRGYGRLTRDLVRVGADTPPLQAGDEPVLIARRTGVPVAVDADRVRAARALIADSCDVLIADDGLQHYRLARDIEIEVVDGLRGYGNGRLLPAGPLREPPARARRCQHRVINGGLPAVSATGGSIDLAIAERAAAEQTADAPGTRDAATVPTWPMQLQIGQAVALRDRRVQPLSAYAGRQVHAIAGIGHPQRFFDALRGAGIVPIEHAFPDHHAFRQGDLSLEPTLPLLMTEKDAVKCRDVAPFDAHAVPAQAQLPDAFFGALLAQLAIVRKAKA